jgi:hypothetical protein
VKTWIGVVVMMLAASCAACGGEEEPARMCDHVATAADVDLCQSTAVDGEAQCDSHGGDLLDAATCQEKVYRDAAVCLYCAPCLEHASRFECLADCDAALAACLKRGNNVVGCQEDQTTCFSACNRAHTCPSM